MSFTLRTWILCAVSVAILGLPPAVQRASADPVTILSGSANVRATSIGAGTFQLRGTDGFRFDARSDDNDNNGLETCNPCTQGQVASFHMTFPGSNFGGTLSFRGRTFTFDPAQLHFSIRGDLNVGGGGPVLPPHPDGTVQLTFPASIGADFEILPEGDPSPFTVNLSGSGIGRTNADILNEDGAALYFFSYIELDFGQAAATPEPASLVLLGSGLVIGGWHRRRRSTTQHGIVASNR